MTIALLTDALEHRSLDDTLGWCVAQGIDAVELGTGGYSPAPHLDRRALLRGPGAPDVLRRRVADAGLEIVALNASGNPLHPDARIAAEHADALTESITLAQALGVPRVVAMSGCPGAPGPSAWPVFAGGAWLPDMENLWEHQWGLISAHWSELSSWAAETAPDVAICLELHPGTSIYNAESFLRLAEITGPNVRVNLDPSHFWWQGIDPVATVAAVGEHIGFVHGKDTRLHADRIALHGVLDFRWPSDADTMPWHFAAVGGGRGLEEWADLLAALAAAGYDGPLSIEHEDPNLTAEDGVVASLRGLRAAQALAAARTAGETVA
jgi:sugar phosphate isomerase/epimerase